MGLVAPVALAFGLLAVPIVALYLLRLRRREQSVSSAFLWRQVISDLEANVPWQRLRPNLLLFLQLLALAVLALALARPYLTRAGQVNADLFLILDASAGMQAKDVRPTRFGAAQQRALDLVSQLPPDNAATVIVMGDVPELLVAQSGDRGALRRAIEAARPGVGGADLPAALSLAASLAREGRDAQAVVLSDGNLTVPQTLGPLPLTVRHEPAGATGENLAVAAFSTRVKGDGIEALARIANHGRLQAQATLQLYLDGTLYDARPLDMPPGAEAVERWATLPQAQVLEARLEPGDAFALDDTAWAVGSTSGRARVLLVTGGNRFLAKALELNPALELTTADPGAYSPEGRYDLWVFDGFLPSVLPTGAVLAVDPPAGNAAWAGTQSGPVTGLRQTGDGLLRYVDLSDLHVLEATPLRPPANARSLLEARQGPLLALWEQPGLRIAALGFDLHESDLPLQPTFPILVQDLAGWLVPGLGQGLAARPGETVDVPVSPEARAAWVETPDGGRVQIAPPYPPQPFPVGGPGLYRIVQDMGDREQVTFFTANLFNPDESAIAPAALPPLEGNAVSGRGDSSFPWELMPWLAAAALLALTVEWWVYNRGR